MKVVLFHVDGKLPNIALMRISAHHRAIGDDVELRRRPFLPTLWDDGSEKVYASLIFERSQKYRDEIVRQWPDAIVGGTGVDVTSSLEAHGITTLEQDYSIYPDYRHSIGFSQRGCRLKCSFCVVPRKEGAVREEKTIVEIWRGESHPREIVLLDNDFFGQSNWRDRIDEMRAGDFRVCFSQGINARFLNDESAEAIASIEYRDSGFKRRQIYTAWDNRKDEHRLFAGLDRLVRYGVKPHHIMVYMLIGYWPGETESDRVYRQIKLREFGAVPYPMPFTRTRELVGFQRWVCGAYDKRIPWDDWKAADYRPEKL